MRIKIGHDRYSTITNDGNYTKVSSIKVQGNAVVIEHDSGHKQVYFGHYYVYTDDMRVEDRIATYVREHALALFDKNEVDAVQLLNGSARSRETFKLFVTDMLQAIGHKFLRNELEAQGYDEQLDQYVEALLLAEWHHDMDVWDFLDPQYS
jgi:hypothetical protein